MNCYNCGNEVDEKKIYCPKCGVKLKKRSSEDEGKIEKCLPAFIVGLLGSIFGMLGGLCVSMCDMSTGGNAPFVLIFGGSIVGMIGACKCLKNVRIGAFLQLLGALMIIICAYGITGADIMSVFGMVLLLAGGIIGLVDYYIIKKKR